MVDEVKVVISADEKPLKASIDRAKKALDDFAVQAEKSISGASGFASTLSSSFAGGQPVIQETTNSIKELSKETGFASDFMNQFKATTLGVAAGQFAFSVIYGAIQSVKEAISQSTAAFAEHEDAVNKLKQSYANVGGASEAVIEGVQGFANALERNSRFADQNIIRQVAFVRSIGASTDQAKEFVKAAANMSAVLGGSLDDNTEKLGKTLSGTIGRLGMLIPELKGLTEEQLKAGKAAEIINAKFSGASANDLNTYSGSLEALKNSFNNLQERVGENIVKSAAYISTVRGLKSAIDGLNDSANFNNTLNTYSEEGQAKTAKTASQLANDYDVMAKRINALNGEISRLKGLQNGNENLFTSGIGAAKIEIKELQTIQDAIEERLKFQRSKVPDKNGDDGTGPQKTKEEQNIIKKANLEIAAIEEQSGLERIAIRNRANIALITSDNERAKAEIDRAYQAEVSKIDIEREKAEDIARTTLEGETKKREIEKVNQEASLKLLEANGKHAVEIEANKRAQIEEINSQLSAFNDLKTNYENMALETQAGQINLNAIQYGLSLEGAEQLHQIELQKIENVRAAELQKASLIKDESKKALATAQADAKADQAIQTANLKYSQDVEKKKISDRAQTYSTIATLAQSNNTVLATIGKAAGITQIAIETPVAIAKAYSAFPPPFNFIAAGLVGVAMAEQAANIAGVKFEQGGIVPGLNQFGDNVQVRVNPGEVILNNSQQKQLLDIANGRNGDSGNNGKLGDLIDAIRNQVISVQVDGREIARTVRNQKMAGFAI